MTVFAYLISDDLQDIYFYIKKKRAVGHGSRATRWPFPDLVLENNEVAGEET